MCEQGHQERDSAVLSAALSAKRRVCHGHFRVTLHVEADVSPVPGQFVEIACLDAERVQKGLAESASGKITVGLYKGNIHFVSLSDCPASIYNEADSSMEASEGLNPASSQGFVEVQSVEAKALARAGQIRKG